MISFLCLISIALIFISCIEAKVLVSYHVSDLDVFKRASEQCFWRYIPRKNIQKIIIGYWNMNNFSNSTLYQYVSQFEDNEIFLGFKSMGPAIELEMLYGELPFQEDPALVCGNMQQEFFQRNFQSNFKRVINFGNKVFSRNETQVQWVVNFFKNCDIQYFDLSLTDEDFSYMKQNYPIVFYNQPFQRLVKVKLIKDSKTPFEQIKCGNPQTRYQIDYNNDEALKKNTSILTQALSKLNCTVNIELKNVLDDQFTARLVSILQYIN